MAETNVAHADLGVEWKPLDLDEQRRMEAAIGWNEHAAADEYRRAMTSWATRVHAPARPGQSRARSRRARTVRKATTSASSSDGDPEPSRGRREPSAYPEAWHTDIDGGEYVIRYLDQRTGEESKVKRTGCYVASDPKVAAEQLRRAREFRDDFTRGFIRIPAPMLNGPGGGMLSPVGERKLGPAAMLVHEHLRRTCGSYEAPCWRSVSYVQIVAATGIPQRSVERAMARLHEAGLIDKVRHRVPCFPGYRSEVKVKVYGVVDRAHTFGVHEPERGTELWVPAATIAWCEQHVGGNGRRPRRSGGSELGVAVQKPARSKTAAPNRGVTRQIVGPKTLTPSTYVLSASQREQPLARPQTLPVQAEGTTAALPVEVEQSLRLREWRALRAGRLQPGAVPAYDARYAELRRREVAAGVLDPMAARKEQP